MTAEKSGDFRALPAPAATLRRASFESLEQTCLPGGEAGVFAARAVHEVSFAIGQSTIAVRFSRASAAAAFAERFEDMLVTRAADAVIYAVGIHREAYFWRWPHRVRRWPTSLSDDLFVFFADSVAVHEYLVASRDMGIHAAVVASTSRVAALVGRSTAGKTTTAIAAARSGFAFYSDERCILAEGRVVPFLRAVTVREGGRAALLADALPNCAVDARLRDLPLCGDTAIPPRALLGEAAGGLPRPLGAVFVIQGRDATPSVERCSPYSVLPALLQSMVSRETGLARPARLLAELRDVPTYRLRLGTPGATVRAIQAVL